MKKLVLIFFSFFIFDASFGQVKVEYLGFDALGVKYKRFVTWGLGYHHELGEKITIGLNYRSYYGFIPPHDRESYNTTRFDIEIIGQNGTPEIATVEYLHDLSWFGFYYSSRYFFTSIRDNGFFIEESIGYYRMKSIVDVINFGPDFGTTPADKTLLGELEQVDILVPIALHFGARAYVETSSKNDLSYDFTVGLQYLTGDANPVMKNTLFRQNGETIKYSKLSFDIAISFGMMF